MTREEAIKELRGFIGQLTEGCQEAIKVLVPELADSEDEGIRKAIVKLVLKAQQQEETSYDDWAYDAMLAWLEKQKGNIIEGEYVFRPLGGTDITIAAEQAIRRANEGDRLVLAFNGAYIPVNKSCTVNKIVDTYNAFVEKQKPADLPPGFYFINQDGKRYYSKEVRYGDMKLKLVENEKSVHYENTKN